MEYLPQGNRVQAGDIDAPEIDAAGKHVIIIGGGDTAADCLGTANRQGALSVTVLDHNPRPQPRAGPGQSGLAVGAEHPRRVARPRRGRARGLGARGRRVRRATTPGRVRAVVVEEVEIVRVDGRREFRPVAGLADRTAGRSGAARGRIRRHRRSGAARRARASTQRPGPRHGGRRRRAGGRAADGVYACGDASRGASLVVWAIAEGRACAAAVDDVLTGASELPPPVAAARRRPAELPPRRPAVAVTPTAAGAAWAAAAGRGRAPARRAAGRPRCRSGSLSIARSAAMPASAPSPSRQARPAEQEQRRRRRTGREPAGELAPQRAAVQPAVVDRQPDRVADRRARQRDGEPGHPSSDERSADRDSLVGVARGGEEGALDRALVARRAPVENGAHAAAFSARRAAARARPVASRRPRQRGELAAVRQRDQPA